MRLPKQTGKLRQRQHASKARPSHSRPEGGEAEPSASPGRCQGAERRLAEVTFSDDRHGQQARCHHHGWSYAQESGHAQQARCTYPTNAFFSSSLAPVLFIIELPVISYTVFVTDMVKSGLSIVFEKNRWLSSNQQW